MTKKFVKGVGLGALLGALAGLLFAPKSGRETRQDIKRGAVKAKDVAADKYDEAKVKTKQVAGRAKTEGRQVVERAKATVRNARNRV